MHPNGVLNVVSGVGLNKPEGGQLFVRPEIPTARIVARSASKNQRVAPAEEAGGKGL